MKMEKKGFSVLEVMIVSLILSILAILSIASFSGFLRGVKLEDCVNRVINFLRYGQEYALTRYDDIFADVLPEENKFILKFTEDRIKEFSLPKGYKMETKLATIIFERMGAIGLFDRPVRRGEPAPTKVVEWIKIIDKNDRVATIEIWGYGGCIFLKSLALQK